MIGEHVMSIRPVQSRGEESQGGMQTFCRGLRELLGERDGLTLGQRLDEPEGLLEGEGGKGCRRVALSKGRRQGKGGRTHVV
jgi:hypothetical protein